MFESKNIQNQLSFDDGLLTKVVDLGIRNNFDRGCSSSLVEKSKVRA